MSVKAVETSIGMVEQSNGSIEGLNATRNSEERVVTLTDIERSIECQIQNNESIDADNFIEFIANQKHLYIKSKTFSKMEGSELFFDGATHMIMAPSKEGKTTFVINEIANITSKKVIVLDGDGNGQDAVSKAGNNTQWFQPVSSDIFLDTILYSIRIGKVDYSDYIFIIDSFKNFRNGISVDGNDASDIVDRLKQLTSTGGSVIILHHITDNQHTGIKMKGNEEAILSSCDITYTYSRADGIACHKSRITGIVNGQDMSNNETGFGSLAELMDGN